MTMSRDFALFKYILEQDVKLGFTVDEAVKKLKKNYPLVQDPEAEKALNEARFEVIRSLGNASKLPPGTALRDPKVIDAPWLKGTDDDFEIYWPYLKTTLEADLGDALQSVDEASTAILQSLRPPAQQSFDTKGLVVGYVQSGKTTSFMSLIAKAADVGYRLIIVLAGITNNLRSQTQERFEEKLISPDADGEARWIKLTHKGRDFSQSQWTAQENATTLLKEPKNRVLAVVKKNSTVLRNLNKFIDESGLANSIPMLIIDDEADQASINVSNHMKDEQSAINAAIKQLLRNQKTAYVAYTATPFANILIDPNTEDLYPKDFIQVLPKPKGHFGTEELFGSSPIFGEEGNGEENDGLDMIRTIPSEEIDDVRPPSRKKRQEGWQPSVPDSLSKAVKWFILAAAARFVRGHEKKHMSMLVHTTVRVDDHLELGDLLRQELALVKKQFKSKELDEQLEDLWSVEAKRVPPAMFELESLEFSDVYARIPDVLSRVNIVVDNGKSEERLNYEEETQLVIAVGGNTLARGLTLEGLMCSYFVRTATAYDTLLQMGRWFGFRNGYQDLPRIWMTEELQSWFQDLAKIEAELREELATYATKEVSPLGYQAKIRTHPAMMVTSKAKQQDARDTDISFSRQKAQTILFHHKDRDWLQKNIEAAQALVSNIKTEGCKEISKDNGTRVFTDVSTSIIEDFLSSYQFVEDSILGRNGAAALLKYVKNEHEFGSIKTWSVSFYGQKKGSNSKATGEIDLGLSGEKLRTINRSKMRISKPDTANIKTLVGSMDRLNDVVWPTDDSRREFTESLKNVKAREFTLVQKRNHLVGSDVGHLAIYVVDKDSITNQPENYKKKDGNVIAPRNQRENLDAVEHMVGVGIFFPESSNAQSAVNYVSAAEYVRITSEDEEDIREYMQEHEEQLVEQVQKEADI